MISPQNLAIGAAAVGMAGQEGDLFRKVVGWSIVLMLAMCALVYLQSTAVLGLDGREVTDGPAGRTAERASSAPSTSSHTGAPAAHLRVRRAAAVRA